MKALIDPRFNRVCELSEIDFPVADPLIWVDATGSETPDSTLYVDGRFVEPPPVVIAKTPEPTKAELLTQINALMAKVGALP